MSSRIDQRRAEFARYKEDVKKRGKPFYPFAMFHDTLMSFVVVGVIIGLACIWKWTSRIRLRHRAARSETPADPGTTNFVPRPDWYFYFLFYLLRIFKWPESVFLGTVGIPTICLILLLSLPFIDLRRERRLLRRPVAVVAAVLVVLSMGVLTCKGATAKEALASEVAGAVPDWVEEAGVRGQRPGGCGRQAVRGLRLHGLSHLSRHRRSEPRRARPHQRGRQEQGDRLPDPPPRVPVVRQRRARRCRRSSRSGPRRSSSSRPSSRLRRGRNRLVARPAPDSGLLTRDCAAPGVVLGRPRAAVTRAPCVLAWLGSRPPGARQLRRASD